MFKNHPRFWLALLCLGMICGIGLVGCQPTATPTKTEKESKATLSPQAMEHFRQAHKFLAEKKLDEAFKEFQETARLAPDSPLAQYWLGKVYFYKKDMAQARKTFEEVLKLDPKNYHALAMLGKIDSFDRAKLPEAQKLLQQALDESPDNLEAHFDLGRVYAMQGDKNKAIREFAFIFNKEAEFALYHYEMGRILEAWGQKEGALTHYKRALVFNPNFELPQQAIQNLEKGSTKATPQLAPKPGTAQPHR
jgi:tetratricopeptide (TPR) repeat protein